MARIGKSLTRNAGAKALALAAALVLWVLISSQEAEQEAFAVSVRYVGVPAGLVVDPEQNEGPTAVLEGSATHLAALRSRGLDVVVDCVGLDNGVERTTTISSENLNLPIGVNLVRAVPSQLRYSLQRSVEAEVAVEPTWSGASDFVIETFEVAPASLRIAGPERRVTLLDRVETDPIDIAGLPEDGVVETSAYLADPKLRFVDNPRVRVEVKVKRR